MAVNINPIPALSKDGEDSVWVFRNSQSGVKQLVAGSGITLSPASGLGAVTVTASGGGGSGTVTSVTAGSSNIVIGGTPTVAPTVDLSANPSVTSLTTSSNLTVGGTAQWGQYSNLYTGAGNTIARLFTRYLAGGNYNSDFFITDNIATFTDNNTASITPTVLDNGVYGVSALRLQSKQIPASGSFQVYTGSNNLATLAPVLEVNSAGLTLNPGASTLAPYTVGGTRNYLDINAPVAIGANKGALRLVGNTATVLTIADTNDLTNIDTLNGHQLYVYGTFRSAAAAFVNIASSPSVSYPQLTTTVVSVGCGLQLSPPSGRYGAFNMTKTGDYNVTAMIHINNTALVDTGTDVFLYNATTSAIVPNSTLTYYMKSGDFTVLNFIGTIPAYRVGDDYVIGFTAFGAGLVLDVPNGTPGTTVQIQLIG
jgi:hypothetical protein